MCGRFRSWEERGAETAHDGWYLLHTNLPIDRADAAQVQGHYKNLLEVEEAFCELKSYLQVRPLFHRKPERVINHVRIEDVAVNAGSGDVPVEVAGDVFVRQFEESRGGADALKKAR